MWCLNAQTSKHIRYKNIFNATSSYVNNLFEIFFNISAHLGLVHKYKSVVENKLDSLRTVSFEKCH